MVFGEFHDAALWARSPHHTSSYAMSTVLALSRLIAQFATSASLVSVKKRLLLNAATTKNRVPCGRTPASFDTVNLRSWLLKLAGLQQHHRSATPVPLPRASERRQLCQIFVRIGNTLLERHVPSPPTVPPCGGSHSLRFAPPHHCELAKFTPKSSSLREIL